MIKESDYKLFKDFGSIKVWYKVRVGTIMGKND